MEGTKLALYRPLLLGKRVDVSLRQFSIKSSGLKDG